MTENLDIHALAAQIEQRCSTLEAEITQIDTQIKTLREQKKAKQDELALAATMRPRKPRTRKPAAVTPTEQPTQ